MLLWSHWWVMVSQLRSACSRQRTFLWLAATLAAMGVRRDLGGVTSFVRALGLQSACYGCLLDFFHSPALGVDALARVWVRVVLKVHPGACGKIIGGLLDGGGHLMSRMKKNACAYAVPKGPGRPGRGRPKRYGTKILLRDLFTGPLAAMPSPIYDDRNVTLKFACHDLLWRPAGRLVRFVAVLHPQRGKILLLCTDLNLPPGEIIRLYALRFKIEVSFKQALHSIGTWAYHFWMRPMTPLRRFQGDQYLHHKRESYRKAVRRKLDAYHRHIQIGLVAQGLLQCLAASHPVLIWRHFGSWLRTVRSPNCPSEFVVACALRHCLPDFLAASPKASSFELFLRERIDLERIEGTCLAA